MWPQTASARLLLAVALLATNMLATSDSLAGEPDRARAREAYASGTARFDEGAYDDAARAYLEADALSPSDAALEATFAALTRGSSDSPVTESFCRRVEERVDAPKKIAAYRALCESRGATFGSIVLTCASACRARLGEHPLDPGSPVAVKPGPLVVQLEIAGVTADRPIVVVAHARATLRGESAPPARSTTRPPARGVSPAWLGIAVGATAAFGAATLVSGVDTMAKHDEFEAMRCGSASATRPLATQSECHLARDEGESSALRTNVFLGVTAASAVATVIFAITAVDFGGDAEVSFVARPDVGVVTGTFRFE